MSLIKVVQTTFIRSLFLLVKIQPEPIKKGTWQKISTEKVVNLFAGAKASQQKCAFFLEPVEPVNLSKFSINEPFSQSDNARFDETMGDIPVISCEGREVLQRTRVRQVFQRVVV